MNKSRNLLSVAECKIQASILLKSIRSDEQEKVRKAAKRFQLLTEFSKIPLDAILEIPFKYKNALAVIALENGFQSWVDLKIQVPFIVGGFLNQWFAHYADAKLYLQKCRGFLLPYKNQFFVCEANYIKQLGFDPNDPDWKLTGYDWANPMDLLAANRLCRKWMQIQEKKSHEL